MTTELRDRLLVMIGGGATIERLAEAADVAPRTVKRWLAEGRKAPAGEHGAFARAFDSAVAPVVAIGPGPMTDDEFELHLAAAIRKRDVRAMKIYEDRRVKRANSDADVPADPFAEFDELAVRRATRT